MAFSLQGAVAVVTGGASGIGAAVVETLGNLGAEPVVWDVAGVPGGVVCDVSEPGAVRDALDATVSTRGVPRALVTCAGMSSFAPVLSIDPNDWDRVMAVNSRGSMLCLQAVASRMKESGLGGSVVLVSSMNGHVPDRGMAAYGASKAAVELLGRVAAAELGRYGIRVNVVAPGVTQTPMLRRTHDAPGFEERIVERTPLGRLGTASEVAEVVVAMLQTEWLTGQVVTADGGLTLHTAMDPYGLFTGTELGSPQGGQ